MANLCMIDMHVRGRKEDMVKFEKALTHKGDVWIGRGSDGDFDYHDDDNTAVFTGSCKWSAYTALIKDAIHMRTKPDEWNFEPGNEEDITFITLIEASAIYNLDVEIYSEEEIFQEHLLIKKGIVEASEEVDFHMEEDTEKVTGGFGKWEFEF